MDQAGVAPGDGTPGRRAERGGGAVGESPARGTGQRHLGARRREWFSSVVRASDCRSRDGKFKSPQHSHTHYISDPTHTHTLTTLSLSNTLIMLYLLVISDGFLLQHAAFQGEIGRAHV